MKKIIFLMIIISLVALTGCGSKGEVEPYTVTYDDSYEDYDVKDPYELKYSEDIINAYVEKIDELEKNRRERLITEYEENSNLDYSTIKNIKYDLGFINDDNIPELIASEEESWVGIYTYKNNKIVFIGSYSNEPMTFDWGSEGNQSYEYIPKGSIIYNVRTDYGKLIYYYNYRKLTKDFKIENLYSEKLYLLHFEDINNNKIPEDDERYSQEIHHFFFGDKEIDEQRFRKYNITDVYENLFGTKNAEEMKYELEELIK